MKDSLKNILKSFKKSIKILNARISVLLKGSKHFAEGSKHCKCNGNWGPLIESLMVVKVLTTNEFVRANFLILGCCRILKL